MNAGWRWITLLACVLAVGCKARLGGRPNADDEIRAQNLKLNKQVEELEEKLELRTGELEALRQLQERGPQPMPGAEAPVLSKIDFDRYSGAIDTNGDGHDDTIRVYVRTLDQHGRMLPVAGRAVLQAVLIEPDTEPSLIAEHTFGPAEWDAAYRAALTGTHHTLVLPLPESLPRLTIEATLKLTFTQADTGATFSAQQAARIDRE